VLARALRPGCDLCLAPVDVPLVPERVFTALAACWRAQGSPAEGWLAPYLAAAADPETSSAAKHRSPRFGHPVIVGRELAARVQDLAPERPLSELRARARPLLALEVDAREVLDDLDTEADLARLAARSPR
jgi:CTP:molybdopterin cytidylyltransferase MocA